MPGSGEAASYGDLLTTSLLVLGGVCVAAFVVVRVLGRFLATGPRRGGHLLDVVARVPLEPRRSLYVVDVAGKTLLVGTSEMGLSVLTELDRDAVKSRVVERPTFAEMVRNAWVKRRARGSSEDTLSTRSDGAGASHAVELPGSKTRRTPEHHHPVATSPSGGSNPDSRRAVESPPVGDALEMRADESSSGARLEVRADEPSSGARSGGEPV